MSDTNNTIQSTSDSLLNIFWGDKNHRNYRIPIYQRRYSWKKDHVDELFGSILDNGFLSIQRSKHGDDYLLPVFLGTLIVVGGAEKSSADQLDDVVDGQQRMITLILIMGEALKQLSELFEKLKVLSGSDDEIASWLKDKEVVQKLKDNLQGCIVAKNANTAKYTHSHNKYSPKLIRGGIDVRSKGHYVSDIASYIMNTVCPEKFEDTGDIDEKLKEHIKKRLEGIAKGFFDENDKDSSDESDSNVKFADLLKTSYQKLVFNEQMSGGGQDADDIKLYLDEIKNSEKSTYKEIWRLACFTNYLLNRVMFNQVTIGNKYNDMTLDIFQALNTTGEHLTAIQILKPEIVEHLKADNYSGSKEENSLNCVDKYLEQKTIIKDPLKESKEVVISFLYYTLGERCDKHLGIQGKRIRQGYKCIADDSDRTRYVTCLQDITDYKNRFWWDQKNLESNDAETVLCCLRYIKESKTMLTIPILTRYALPVLQKKRSANHESFANAVKSLTAFMVLRRSITSGTERIDDDFRKILGKNSIWAKDSHNNSKNRCQKQGSFLDSKEELNKELKKLLKKTLEKKLGENLESVDKKEWLKIATRQRMYELAKPATCKFILLCSASDTKVNNDLLEKSFSAPGENVLTVGAWGHQFHSTVEHVAPQNKDKGGEWKREKYDEIYKDNKFHCIGNLTLLPSKDNDAVGNAPFKKKKEMYKVWIEQDRALRGKLMDDLGLKEEKSQFSIDKGSSNKNLLQPIINTEDWTFDAINNRSRNLLELTWDKIAPWLDIKT